MSILVIQLPAQARVHARAQGTAEPPEVPGLGTEYDYVVTSDGLAVTSQGRSAARLLPRAHTVVAVLADVDVSWHRITLPKAPSQRLREALAGVLEEALLDEDVHLALAPNASPGQPTWVACVSRPRLVAQLAALERGQVFVDRVVPLAWPDDPPLGHFAAADDDPAGSLGRQTLTWAHADGVATLRLQGGLARALLPNPIPAGARWSATPAAAKQAGEWLGSPVAVMTPAQRALQATRSTWNLRQFDLAPRHRGARALRDAWRRFRSPGWRPVRVGLAALVVLQVVALNLAALRQRHAIEERQDAMVKLLRATYPQVRAVLDAPVQMRRETEVLRSAAGKAGEADLEPMLQAAASAWPANRPAVESLRYEPGRLTLSAAGFSNEEIEQFRSRLQGAGWRVELADGRLTLTRADSNPTGKTS
jgi:general secretion pathway protein L